MPTHPGRFRLLVAAESAGALVAAEMGARRPALAGRRARRAAARAARRPVGGRRPAGPAGDAGRRDRRGVRRALPASRLTGRAAQGLRPGRASTCPTPGPGRCSRSTTRRSGRCWPTRSCSGSGRPTAGRGATPWVRDGRFRAEYVPGGVVSGRWATRGGGALQIPKVVRRAVIADPGWRLVVADAGQLEPRVLAAVSGDARLAAAAPRRRPLRGAGQRGVRRRAGQGQGRPARRDVRPDRRRGHPGPGGAAQPATRRRSSYVESAARTGEGGGLVRSWLGRTCPPSSVGRWASRSTRPARGGRPDSASGPRPAAASPATSSSRRPRPSGRLALLATLRRRSRAPAAELVFFQHDEVMVHCPAEQADVGDRGGPRRRRPSDRRLLFGDTEVRFPMEAVAVDCYAEAK